MDRRIKVLLCLSFGLCTNIGYCMFIKCYKMSSDWILYYYRPLKMTEFGPLANPRLCIMADSGSVKYKWQVLFRTVSDGKYSTDQVRVYLEQLKPQSGYKVCPGLNEYPEEVRFETKNVRLWGLPFNRVDAQSCSLWHIPNNVNHPAGDKLRDTCRSCRLLNYDLNRLVERACDVSVEQKIARTSVQSNYPIKYLSPASKSVRVSKLSKERKNLTAKLSSVSNLEYDLNDKQHTRASRNSSLDQPKGGQGN